MKLRRIRSNRKAKEIAERANIAQGYYSQIENDKKRGSIDVLQKIAEVLGVPLSEIIDDPPGVTVAPEPARLRPLVREDFIFELAPYAKIRDRARKETRLLTPEDRHEAIKMLQQAIHALQKDVPREQSV